MAEPQSEAPKPRPKEVPSPGAQLFELGLADRIAQSKKLPTGRSIEREGYDFSTRANLPDLSEQTELFGLKEMADFAEHEKLGTKKRLEFKSEAEFGGKKYDALRIVLAIPHAVEGLPRTDVPSDIPSKVASALFLREKDGEPFGDSTLRQKLKKLADKSAVGRALRAIVTGEQGPDVQLQDGQFPTVDVDSYDSIIYGLWVNPTRSKEDGTVLYQDAQLEVLHPDYTTSRRAMQYGVGISFDKQRSALNVEPLRTDKSANELYQEQVDRAMRNQEDGVDEQERPIPSRTAWASLDGKNITAMIKESAEKDRVEWDKNRAKALAALSGEEASQDR